VTNITNVSNVTNVHIYNQTVVNNTTVNNVSYNGGTGGTAATPTTVEEAAAREPHTPPTAEQTQHEHTASANPALRESVNHGKPANCGDFEARSIYRPWSGGGQGRGTCIQAGR
jgi:hypothetical protein